MDTSLEKGPMTPTSGFLLSSSVCLIMSLARSAPIVWLRQVSYISAPRVMFGSKLVLLLIFWRANSMAAKYWNPGWTSITPHAFSVYLLFLWTGNRPPRITSPSILSCWMPGLPKPENSNNDCLIICQVYISISLWQQNCFDLSFLEEDGSLLNIHGLNFKSCFQNIITANISKMKEKCYLQIRLLILSPEINNYCSPSFVITSLLPYVMFSV